MNVTLYSSALLFSQLCLSVAASIMDALNPMSALLGFICTILISALVYLHCERRHSRVIYQSALSASMDGFLFLRKDGQILEVNSRLETMTGYSRAELQNMNLAQILHSMSPVRLEQWLSQIKMRVQICSESRWRRKDGTVFDAEISLSTAPSALNGAFVFLHDVTLRNQTMEEQHRLNRALRARSDCSRALLEAGDEVKYLENVCRILVEGGGYRMAWVGYPQFDDGKSVKAMAQAGFHEGYLETVNITWSDSERGQGQTGLCIRNCKPVVINNVATNPAMALWRDNAARHGYASSAAFPLTRGDEMLGALMVYSAIPDAFDENEVSLLTDLANDLAFGVGTLRTNIIRTRAEFSLKKRLCYESALTRVSLILRQTSQFSDSIGEMLRILIDASGMDRAYIFHNHNDPELGLCSSQVQECTKPGIAPQIDNPVLQKIPYQVVSPSGRLLDCFKRGEPFRGPVSELPQSDKEIYEFQGIKDILLLPIFSSNELWGFLGFDDFTTVGRFDEYDVALLQNMANIVGWHLDSSRDKEALQKSQANLANLMSNLPGMAYRRSNDNGWTILFASEGCLSITGYQPADLIESKHVSYAALIHRDDRPYAWNSIQKALNERQKFQITYRIQNACGEIKWVWEQGIGIYSSSGVLLAMEGFILDVTAQKTAEIMLAKYQILSDYANDIILFVRQQDGQILEVNNAACASYGWDRSELLTKRIHDLRSKLDVAELALQMEKASNNGLLFETMHLRKNGTSFPVEVSSRAVTIGTEKVLLSVVRDISERKQAEQALLLLNQELEQRVKERTAEALNLYNNAPCGYHLLGPDGLVLQMNDTELNWLGYKRSEVENCVKYQDLLAPTDITTFEKFHSQFFLWNVRKDLECQLRCRNGSIITVLLTVATVRDEKGQLVRTRSTAINISERKKTEQALLESETNFRTFFETIDDLIIVAKPDGRILFANHAVKIKLGYTSEELTTLHVLDLNPKESRNDAETIFTAMLRGERKMCPLPLVAKNGVSIPSETRIWLGRWNSMDCIFGVSKDLSAEIEAQQRFECLFRDNPALMALTTFPDRRFYDVNNAFIKVLGYSKSEILGKTSSELALFIAPQQQQTIADLLMNTGHVKDVELQVRHRNGSTLSGLFSGEIIVNQGQQYFLSVMIDITERKQIEADLQNERRRLAGILEGTNVGTWEWNVQSGEVLINSRWAEMIGFSRSEERRVGKECRL